MNIKEVLATAIKDHQSGQLESALEGYLSVLKEAPNHPDALHLLGALFLGTGQAKKAIALLEKCLTFAPNFHEARVSLGNAYKSIHYFNAAVSHYNKAIPHLSSPANALVNLGTTLLALRRPEEAEEKFSKALEIDPERHDIHVFMANALAGQDRYDEAEASFCRAIDEAPEVVGFRLDFGRLLKHQGKLEQANAQFSEVLKQDPKNEEAYQELIFGLLVRNQDDPSLVFEEQFRDLAAREEPHTLRAKHAYLAAKDFVERDTTAVKRIRLLEASGLKKTSFDSGFDLFELSDVSICNKFWYIWDDEALYPNLHAIEPHDLPWKGAFLCPANRAIMENNLSRYALDETVFLLGGCKNYYHWLIDYLPTVRILAENPEYADVPILVNPDLASFQLESLKALGIDISRLRHFDNIALLDCKSVLVPILPGKRGRSWGAKDWWWRPTITAEIIFWMRDAFLPEKSAKPNRKIFISRRDEESRGAINREEIEEVASDLGYAIIYLDRLSFAAQIRLFSTATHIAGFHGAGFANIVFAPKGTKVIEFVGDWMPPDFYKHMAGLCGHDFASIHCSTTDFGDETLAGDRRFNKIVIDPKVAKAAMSC